MRLLFTGRRRKAIAQEMGISPWTVRQHVTSAYRKLGCHSAVEALRTCLLTPELRQYLSEDLAALLAEQWHHVVATYDGSNVRMYQDGSLSEARIG
jgi:DNA-binding NarL/FixJ family response regulator